MSFFRGADIGPTFIGPGLNITFVATAAETDGAYIALETLVAVDSGPLLHIHHNQVETFYIVEGQLEIVLGDQVHEAKAGDFAHVSKGTPHRFLNRSQTPAKMMVTFVPAGDMEQFFREAFEQTADRHAPLRPINDALRQRLLEAGERHDLEFVPPPEA